MSGKFFQSLLVLCIALSLSLGLDALLSIGREGLLGVRVPAFAAIAALTLSALVFLQIGRGLVHFSFAPVFPRESYYGQLKIAAERPERERVERNELHLFLIVAGLVLLGVVGAPVVGAPLLTTAAALVVGALFEGFLLLPHLRPGTAAALEGKHRGKYVLYLRNFRKSRWWVVIASLSAAHPNPVFMIISPWRREARAISWYLFAILSPFSLHRLLFWSTAHENWHNIAASCMNRAGAIVIDCAELVLGDDERPTGGGLRYEAQVSIDYAGRIPIAYVVDHDFRATALFPPPAILRAGSSSLRRLLHFPGFSRRLRAVVKETLSAEELKGIREYHAEFRDGLNKAWLQDRASAVLKGEEDPWKKVVRQSWEGPEARGAAKRDPLQDWRDRLEIGDMAVSLEESDTALKLFADAARICETAGAGSPAAALDATSPIETHWRRLLAISYGKCAEALSAAKKAGEARDYYERALSQHERLLERDPACPRWKQDLTVGLVAIGDHLIGSDDPSAALDFYQRGEAIAQTIAAPKGNGFDPEATKRLFDERLSAAQLKLGLKLMEDNKTGIDWTRVTRLFRESAERGNARAAFALGSYHENHAKHKFSVDWWSVSFNDADRQQAPPDSEMREALRWYLRSAELGFDESQFRVAEMLASGSAGVVDHAAARQWLQRAAEQGHERAIERLHDGGSPRTGKEKRSSIGLRSA